MGARPAGGERGAGGELELAVGDLRNDVLGGQDLALLGHLQAALHRAGRQRGAVTPGWPAELARAAAGPAICALTLIGEVSRFTTAAGIFW